MFWGLSPALDLQNEFLQQCSDEIDEMNILIVGGCDARHILKTLAQAYRHRKTFINFYVIEGCPELVIRQILLISIAFEHPLKLGLLEKARIFMEIFGNSLLRSSTSRFVAAKARRLTTMITNLDLMSKCLPMISIDKMKYRERDYMEVLLKFWETGNTNQFDICELWDRRMRSHLGVRYDSRHGAFDWDYHMRLTDMGGKGICGHEYKHFRETGVSFTWLETEVCRPNVTLSAGVFTCGERFMHRGYLGDIVTGPFIGYGTDCEDKELMKTANGVNLKRSTDITERNIIRMFYELEHRQTLDAKMMSGDTEHNLGIAKLSKFDARLSDETDSQPLNLIEDEQTYINIGYASINFISLGALDHYPDKEEFKNFFHVTFVGQNLLWRMQPAIFEMIHRKGLVIFEGKKFILDMKKDHITDFGNKLTEVAIAGGCVALGSYDPLKDTCAKFILDPEKRNTIDLEN